MTGCAGDPELYPSLSIRDEERISGTFEPVEPEVYEPVPIASETLGRIDALREQARLANERFLAAAERLRGPIAQARGAEPGSISWSKAQVALAELQSSRSDAMIALADLDAIYLETQLESGNPERIATARSEVAALVASQDRLIEAIRREVDY